MKLFEKLFLFFVVILLTVQTVSQAPREIQAAPAPLFRDPVTDGAADPCVIYNRVEKSWWIVYTQRRANIDLHNVAFCYGNAIGIASSDNHGKTWVYRGVLDLDFEPGHNTFWAPDVFYHNGNYHMYVTYIKGVRSDWGGESRLAYYTSRDLWNWKFHKFIDVGMKNIIDGSVMQMPDKKTWRMWYRGDHGWTRVSESKDLLNWKLIDEPAIKGDPHEGPNVFEFSGYYWMLTDEWSGMRVYKSSDLLQWEKQGNILDKPGIRKDDNITGAHGDAFVAGDKAFIVYFTHPGRKSHSEASLNKSGNLSYEEKRSSLQVAELICENGTLVCKRDEPFNFWLP